MRNLTYRLAALRCDKRAAALIEYGLLAALVAILAIDAASDLGQNTAAIFINVANNL